MGLEDVPVRLTANSTDLVHWALAETALETASRWRRFQVWQLTYEGWRFS